MKIRHAKKIRRANSMNNLVSERMSCLSAWTGSITIPPCQVDECELRCMCSYVLTIVNLAIIISAFNEMKVDRMIEKKREEEEEPSAMGEILRDWIRIYIFGPCCIHTFILFFEAFTLISTLVPSLSFNISFTYAHIDSYAHTSVTNNS